MGHLSLALPALGGPAARIFDAIVCGLQKPGEARRIGDCGAAFMALSVECIGPGFYSLAHYFEQNGDLMADPEMVFWRAPDGRVHPVAFKQDSLGLYRECLVFERGHYSAAEWPTGSRPRLCRELAAFARTWLRNIRDQQRLSV